MPVACATCHVKVSRVTDPVNGEWWGHPTTTDHEVVPVELPESEVTRVCDFCLLPGPTWAFPLLEHADTSRWNPSLGLNVTALDTDGWWAACDLCADLIRERNISGLRNRALATAIAELRRPLSRWEKQSVFDQLSAFWLARPGSPVETSLLEAD